jgi:type IV pilus assembly protein PilQ
VDLKEADLHDVFRLVAQAARINVVVSDAVQGKVTLRLTAVTWRELLNVLLRAHGLSAEEEGEVLWITTLQERREQLKTLRD